MNKNLDSIKLPVAKMSVHVIFEAIRDYINGKGQRSDSPIGDLREEAEIFIFDEQPPEKGGSFAWYCSRVGLDHAKLQTILKSDTMSPSLKRAIGQFTTEHAKLDYLLKAVKKEIAFHGRESRCSAPSP